MRHRHGCGKRRVRYGLAAMSLVDRALVQAVAGERLAVLLASYHRLTGDTLAADADELWAAPLAVVAHDIADPPAFFYANRAALALFAMPARRFIGMPSAHSAPPAERAERAAMLAQLQRANVVRGYTGLRVAADGTLVRIRDAVLWNLIDEAGARHGQAAAIPAWEVVEPSGGA